MTDPRKVATSTSRLRFFFDDAVFAVRLPAHATYGDIAWMMAALGPYHDGIPVAIDVARNRLAISSHPVHGA